MLMYPSGTRRRRRQKPRHILRPTAAFVLANQPDENPDTRWGTRLPLFDHEHLRVGREVVSTAPERLAASPSRSGWSAASIIEPEPPIEMPMTARSFAWHGELSGRRVGGAGPRRWLSGLRDLPPESLQGDCIRLRAAADAGV